MSKLSSEKRWEKLFAESEEALEKLADEALRGIIEVKHNWVIHLILTGKSKNFYG